MRFAGMKDDRLADPLVVYLFRPGQITQASVVIFLELSVAHIVSHAEKYPQPILAVAMPAFVTKKTLLPVSQKSVPNQSDHDAYLTLDRRLPAKALPD